MLDWAASRRIGFSAVLSVGDMADADFGDLVALFAEDEATSAILLYVEGIVDAAGFLAAAGAASLSKPVIAIKAGRSQAASKAALSHTGALAGSYDIYRAAFRRAGVILVETLDELFDAAAAVEAIPPLTGDRLAILTNGGGAGILAVDALDTVEGRLAPISDAALAALDSKLPAGWSRANPLDIIGDAHADRYCIALETLLTEPEVDAVLVVNCPTALASGREVAEAVTATIAEARMRGSDKPVLACWLGDGNAAAARDIFAEAEIPLYETPGDAVRGFSYLVQAGAERRRIPPDRSGASAERAGAEAVSLIATVRADNRTLLSEIEAKQLLALFGIPVTPTKFAKTPAEVAEACAEFAAPFVVKIVSPDMTHKSDVGGVVLGLADAEAAEAAAEAMQTRLREAFPDARLDGFAVQPMIRRKHAHELFAGIVTDPTFGTVLMFGAGGTAVEVLHDKVIGLPPLDRALARSMIAETRIAKLLAGYRDRPAADIEGIADMLCALSAMAVAVPDIVELDVNPLLADAEGAIALDARVVITSEPAEASHVALLGRD
jgi:acetyltransferase